MAETGPGIRAGDEDRDAAAETLAEAVAAGRLTLEEHNARLDALYTAVTAGEVAAVIADLPAAPARRGALYQAFDPYRAIVIGGRGRRVGRWRVGRFCTAVAVFARLDLDMRAAQPNQDEVQLTVWGLAGRVAVRVPAGWRVVNQVVALGPRRAVADHDPGPGAPILRLKGMTVGGSFSLARG